MKSGAKIEPKQFSLREGKLYKVLKNKDFTPTYVDGRPVLGALDSWGWGVWTCSGDVVGEVDFGFL